MGPAVFYKSPLFLLYLLLTIHSMHLPLQHNSNTDLKPLLLLITGLKLLLLLITDLKQLPPPILVLLQYPWLARRQMHQVLHRLGLSLTMRTCTISTSKCVCPPVAQCSMPFSMLQTAWSGLGQCGHIQVDNGAHV